MTGDDVDHPLKCVGSISRCRRTTSDLDAFDILDLDRKIIPHYPRQTGQILGAAVDHHQHTAHIARLGAVITDRGNVTVNLDCAHSRHQLQQLVNLPGTTGLDQLTINHRHTGRNLGLRLTQTRRRQHHRHLIITK